MPVYYFFPTSFTTVGMKEVTYTIVTFTQNKGEAGKHNTCNRARVSQAISAREMRRMKTN